MNGLADYINGVCLTMDIVQGLKLLKNLRMVKKRMNVLSSNRLLLSYLIDAYE